MMGKLTVTGQEQVRTMKEESRRKGKKKTGPEAGEANERGEG